MSSKKAGQPPKYRSARAEKNAIERTDVGVPAWPHAVVEFIQKKREKRAGNVLYHGLQALLAAGLFLGFKLLFGMPDTALTRLLWAGFIIGGAFGGAVRFALVSAVFVLVLGLVGGLFLNVPVHSPTWWHNVAAQWRSGGSVPWWFVGAFGGAFIIWLGAGRVAAKSLGKVASDQWLKLALKGAERRNALIERRKEEEYARTAVSREEVDRAGKVAAASSDLGEPDPEGDYGDEDGAETPKGASGEETKSDALNDGTLLSLAIGDAQKRIAESEKSEGSEPQEKQAGAVSSRKAQERSDELVRQKTKKSLQAIVDAYVSHDENGTLEEWERICGLRLKSLSDDEYEALSEMPGGGNVVAVSRKLRGIGTTVTTFNEHDAEDKASALSAAYQAARDANAKTTGSDEGEDKVAASSDVPGMEGVGELVKTGFGGENQEEVKAETSAVTAKESVKSDEAPASGHEKEPQASETDMDDEETFAYVASDPARDFSPVADNDDAITPAECAGTLWENLKLSPPTPTAVENVIRRVEAECGVPAHEIAWTAEFRELVDAPEGRPHMKKVQIVRKLTSENKRSMLLERAKKVLEEGKKIGENSLPGEPVNWQGRYFVVRDAAKEYQNEALIGQFPPTEFDKELQSVMGELSDVADEIHAMQEASERRETKATAVGARTRDSVIERFRKGGAAVEAAPASVASGGVSGGLREKASRTGAAPSPAAPAPSEEDAAVMKEERAPSPQTNAKAPKIGEKGWRPDPDLDDEEMERQLEEHVRLKRAAATALAEAEAKEAAREEEAALRAAEARRRQEEAADRAAKARAAEEKAEREAREAEEAAERRLQQRYEEYGRKPFKGYPKRVLYYDAFADRIPDLHRALQNSFEKRAAQMRAEEENEALAQMPVLERYRTQRSYREAVDAFISLGELAAKVRSAAIDALDLPVGLPLGGASSAVGLDKFEKEFMVSLDARIDGGQKAKARYANVEIAASADHQSSDEAFSEDEGRSDENVTPLRSDDEPKKAPAGNEKAPDAEPTPGERQTEDEVKTEAAEQENSDGDKVVPLGKGKGTKLHEEALADSRSLSHGLGTHFDAVADLGIPAWRIDQEDGPWLVIYDYQDVFGDEADAGTLKAVRNALSSYCYDQGVQTMVCLGRQSENLERFANYEDLFLYECDADWQKLKTLLHRGEPEAMNG